MSAGAASPASIGARPSFQSQAFTSTLHDHTYRPLFNVWLVVLTAIFFFLILSWYNFAFAIYNFYINPNDTDREVLKNEILTSTGFLAVWTLVAVFVYLILNHFELLGSSDLDVTGEHPVLQDELRVARDVTIAGSADLAVA